MLDEPFGALDAISRRQVRDELSDILAELGLPTLVVTHAFDDAPFLAHRIGVLDNGRLVQDATPNELLAKPANVTVAALTGANILEGVATITRSGSTVRLHGGGELYSAMQARGPVHIAVHPWHLEPADPHDCPLTDTVRSVRRDRGGLTIRLTRFTMQRPAGDNGHVEIAEGSIVGLRAAPSDVHIVDAAAGAQWASAGSPPGSSTRTPGPNSTAARSAPSAPTPAAPK